MPFIVATVAAVAGYVAPTVGLSALGFGAAGMLNIIKLISKFSRCSNNVTYIANLGPVAGSVAAVTQAGIGSVAAGSAFATLQAAGMTGVPAVLSAATGKGF